MYEVCMYVCIYVCSICYSQGARSEQNSYFGKLDLLTVPVCVEEIWYNLPCPHSKGRNEPSRCPLLLSLLFFSTQAFGGNDEFVGSGPVDDSVLPARMEVDFVRVYQSPEMFEDDGSGDGDGSRSVYLRDATGGGSRQGVEIWGDEFNGTEVCACMYVSNHVAPPPYLFPFVLLLLPCVKIP